MLGRSVFICYISNLVSVAGCLGYDVLDEKYSAFRLCDLVSVAGCLGYDVLDKDITNRSYT